MKVIKSTDLEERKRICRKVVEDLPDFYKESRNIKEYIEMAGNPSREVYIIEDKEPVGLAVVSKVKPNTFEIDAIGVVKEYRRKKAGTELLETIFNEHQNNFLVVKALDECENDNEFYAIARKFYEKLGFIPLLKLPELWGKDYPCMLMVKSLV